MSLDVLNNDVIEQFMRLLSLIPQITNQNVSLETFTDEYMKYIKANKSIAYWKSHQLSFGHLMSYFQKQKLMGTITFREAEMFITHLQANMGEGYRVYYRNIKTAFNKALLWGYVSENPFSKIRLPKIQKNHPTFITKDELGVILSEVELEVVRDFSILSFYTGCRLGEIVNLTWENVNLGEEYIIIGDEEFITKGKNQRTIPLSNEAKSVLEQKYRKCKKKEGFVFRKSSGKPFTTNYVSKKFKQGCRKAGVSEKIHFHTLRHSFASTLAQRGVSIYVIQKLLGHSSVSTTEIYSHLNRDALNEAIKVFNK